MSISKINTFLQHLYHICKNNPSYFNLLAYENEWKIYKDKLNFLLPSSPFYKLKNFQTKIYLSIFYPYINKLNINSKILDAGCGIGRFAIPLVKKGYKVYLVDSSITALKVAKENMKKVSLKNFKVYLSDIENMKMFKDNTFDATFAIEAICYCNNPKKALKEIIRVTKNDGYIFLSVEAKYGSLLTLDELSIDKIDTILTKNKLLIENYLYVHYFTYESLKKLLEDANLKILNITPCHFIADGILNKLFGQIPEKELLKLEKELRKDNILKNLCRAYAVVCCKKN